MLRKETVSISGKIAEFRTRIKVGELSRLRSLLTDENSRPETVVTFLASLELSRLRKLRLHQEATYADIYLELMESLSNFNEGDVGTQFDNPNPQPGAEQAEAANPHPVSESAKDFQFLHIPEDGADSALSVDLLREELAAPNAVHS